MENGFVYMSIAAMLKTRAKASVEEAIQKPERYDS